jgi:hypothetical protein
MKIVTKIERVQPWVVGVDASGELIWEGQAMQRWQMELLRVTVDWFAPFFTRWLELSKYESRQEEFNERDGAVATWITMSKKTLDSYRTMYPQKRRAVRRHGD